MVNYFFIAAKERLGAELNKLYSLFQVLQNVFALLCLENVCEEFEAC